jgi:hypothetical protein
LPAAGQFRRVRLHLPRRPGDVVVEELLVIGQNRAPLAGVQVLARLETEAPCPAVRADLASAPLGKVRLARILDDGDAAVPRNGQNGVSAPASALPAASVPRNLRRLTCCFTLPPSPAGALRRRSTVP